MKQKYSWLMMGVAGVAALLVVVTSSEGLQAQGLLGLKRTYEVSVTNLTRGQHLTPRLVVVHGPRVRLFDVGEAASPALAILAEQGDTVPLTNLLVGAPGVWSVETAGGLLEPGATHRVMVQGRPGERLTVASMLIPTNDGFFIAQGLELPRHGEFEVVTSPVYDAGSERNDEQCASIPGPSFVECGGPGGGAVVGGGEGFVHIHAGMHGVGEFVAAERDWRNPAVRIAVRLVR